MGVGQAHTRSAAPLSIGFAPVFGNWQWVHESLALTIHHSRLLGGVCSSAPPVANTRFLELHDVIVGFHEAEAFAAHRFSIAAPVRHAWGKRRNLTASNTCTYTHTHKQRRSSPTRTDQHRAANNFQTCQAGVTDHVDASPDHDERDTENECAETHDRIKAVFCLQGPFYYDGLFITGPMTWRPQPNGGILGSTTWRLRCRGARGQVPAQSVQAADPSRRATLEALCRWRQATRRRRRQPTPQTRCRDVVRIGFLATALIFLQAKGAVRVAAAQRHIDRITVMTV
jgi:hypothetical protein